MRQPSHRVVPSRRRFCAAGLLALTAPAFPGATPLADAAPPSEVAQAMASARLHGSGRLRFFGLHVYDARLWVDATFVPHRYEEHAFALELLYARKLDGAAIAQRSITEMRRAGPISDSQALAWEAALVSAFPNVDAGDRLTGVHMPDKAVRFFHNGRDTAAVMDPAFGRAFFGIWLAPTTSEPDLRRQLIRPAA